MKSRFLVVVFAKNNDYKSLMMNTLKKTYSSKKVANPFISRIGKPKDFSRFIIQANAVLTHDTYSELNRITCPTLIIGGESDKVVGPDASTEMVEKIPNNQVLVYNGLGHAVYEEAKDFNKQVKDFLLN